MMNLPPLEELKILQDRFWFVNYFNTFTIYVGITKGQRPSFKEFLCDGNNAINISLKFLNDVDLCLRLYHCFYEAGDEKMCASIAKSKVFNERKIESRANSPSYMECLALFLTTSFHQTWVKLTLKHIQDYEFHILHRNMNGSNITITKLRLFHCGLTSSSSMFVSDIAISCRTRKLMLDGNKTIGENEQLYSMLSHPSSTLEILSLYQTKLSSKAANILFTTLEKNNTLKILSIEDNDITDDTCPFIANTLKLNNCLAKLWMRFNPISTEAIKLILKPLRFNNTLKILRLPDYPDDVKKNFKSEEENINTTRENHGCQVKLIIDFNIVREPLY